MPRSGLAHNYGRSLANFRQRLVFPPLFVLHLPWVEAAAVLLIIVKNLIEICKRGLDLSPTHELLIDESIIGWKEFELEVVRDQK